ncbi:MAG: SGNH/GDSL hydrolase family protein [Planctomycetes bacterium]|nr:SGNH/GDSL hydrolase family protein [Planctomycetota bacterium]
MRIQLTDEPIYLQEPGHERTGHRYLYDENLGWRNIPGWSATTNGRKLTINSKGLRDREHAYEKPKNTQRILVLGDSYAWGYGVADDEIFTAQLQRLLDRKPFLPTGKFSVINSGVSGWGTDQEYLFLKREGFKYSPDVVVLAFLIVNDIRNNSVSIQYGMHKPVFLDCELNLANVPVPRPFSQHKEIRSKEDPLEITIAIIERMNDECRKRNCRLIVMKFGQFLPGADATPYFQNANRRLRAELNGRMKIPYFDLDREFSAGGISTDTLIRGNDGGHWNARGHRLVAEYLYKYLGKLKLFKSN